MDREHGYATGTSTQCDLDSPPEHRLYHAGFTLVRRAGASPLHGAGGYFTGTYGANVAIVLDGDWQNPIGGGKLIGGAHQFFGLIDTGPLGVDEIQFREIDGKVGQSLFIFADDFTVLTPPVAPIPTLGDVAALASLRCCSREAWHRGGTRSARRDGRDRPASRQVHPWNASGALASRAA